MTFTNDENVGIDRFLGKLTEYEGDIFIGFVGFCRTLRPNF